MINFAILISRVVLQGFVPDSDSPRSTLVCGFGIERTYFLTQSYSITRYIDRVIAKI